MFGSISTATPNTTVTSSFTADENCLVGVGEGYVVRVNGQPTSLRQINLLVNDFIEIDVTAPGSDNHSFIPWTYNGTQCYFAVVSKQASNKPTLLATYRNRMWYDYPVSASRIVAFKSGSNAPINLPLNTDSGNPTTDLAVVLDPKAAKAYGIRADGAQVYTITLGSIPLSHTRTFNGTTRQWFSYFLGTDGFIYQVSQSKAVVKSTVSYPNAKCIFSDSSSIYVGGTSLLINLADMNTTSRTYTISETITMGAAVGSLAVAVTATGKLLKIGSSALTTLYSASMIGMPCSFQNSLVVPIPEEYKLRVYNNDGTFNTDIDLGANIPMAVGADRNAKMSVAFADSSDVWSFTNVTSSSHTVDTFNYIVAFAQPIGAGLVADHYLREFTTTSPPNPVVSGVTFPTWQAPVDVDVGSGEFNVMSQADLLTCAVAPNAKLLVNGSMSLGTVAPTNRVSTIMRSVEGRRSTAVRIGNYAFDWKVKAHNSGQVATAINIPNKFLSSQVVFTVVLPANLVPSPVAVSHGTMKLNGATYNGTQPVGGGDTLTVTLNIPVNLTQYYSMLSIADSQYALTVNTASTNTADIQRYRPYGDLTTVSSVKVNETGWYDFPNYSTGSVSKNGIQLTFPTTLTNGDTVDITHQRVSYWWLDARDTVLMGPSTNYVVKSYSTVNDQPVNVDFGTVHMGIPDFDSTADNTPVISGLSNGYSIVIYSDHMTFSVNGALAVATPTVKNGDTVQAIYNVLNLWENRLVNTTLYDGTVYSFGTVHIDPPLGVSFTPTEVSYYEPATWDLVQNNELPSQASTSEILQVSYMDTSSSVSLWAQVANGLKTPSSVSQYSTANVGLLTPSAVSQYSTTTLGAGVAPISDWAQTNPQYGTNSAVSAIYAPNSVAKTKTSTLSLLASRYSYASTKTSYFDQEPDDTYEVVDVANNYSSSFGHEVIFRRVDAYWLPLQDVPAPLVTPSYQYVGSQEDRHFTAGWNLFTRPSYLNFEPIWARIVKADDVLVTITSIYDFTDYYHTNEISGRYAYMAWNHEETVVFEPLFVGNDKILKAGGQYIYLASKNPLFGNNDPMPVPALDYPVAASVGSHDADILWNTNLPLQTGGFATLNAAQLAGKAASGSLTVTAYQQPEGSFSYVVKRQTSLVCDIKPSSMEAKAWLLGGG